MNSGKDFSQMLPVGTVLDGRYRIERYLASGGFGNTYEAVDTKLGCRVAVKEFFLSQQSTRGTDGCSVTVTSPSARVLFEHYLEKFKTEARRISQLRNNHIVRVSDLFDANDTSYYVMDFVDGESLKKRIQNGGPLSAEEAVKTCRQVLDALEVIHRAGLYHLDVKPANIMLTAGDEAVLIDFGASKQIDSTGGVTLHSQMVFSPGYAPSEQMDGKADRVGPWTDFYALGATLYAMLSGQTPPSPSDITDDGEDAFSFVSWPSALKQAVLKMMFPSTKKRPQNVEEVRALLEGKPAEKNPVNSGETTILPTPVNPAPNVGQKSEGRRNENPVHENDLPVSRDDAVVPARPNETSQETQIIGNKDRTFTVRGVSFKMIAVEGGTFMMGATPEQGEDARQNEKPAHQVTLDGFMIGETVVTQALWKAVMGNNPSRFKDDDRPVETVSWNDCQNFITQLNSMTGEHFRLPTEAEWEFAARGGNKSNHTKYAGGSDIYSVGWFCENSKKSKSFIGRMFSEGSTQPVAMKDPNELGLYDMSGNVWEWCQDWYDKDYFSKSPVTNPYNEIIAYYHVDRGGGWINDVGGCRVSSRDYFTPDYAFDALGLRLAL
ncbi:MAG: SUMF1/EgtB/PvdO family nonheme iron enzyme [Prevotella sp.]|nr:SUMF1/EgtB/PvdO family nonheme iron enzyme [Prevotella sp.]